MRSTLRDEDGYDKEEVYLLKAPNNSNPDPPEKRNIPGIDLIFRNINLSVKKRKILDNVFGAAAQGDMLAVMGPSGSGKTSLLNSLAGCVPLDDGEILGNGVKFTKLLRRNMSYIPQDELFFDKLTMRETLTFAALLRLPDKMPWKDKKERIDEIIEALDLTKCQNTVIGGVEQRGLSGGEKKRTNIACELLTNPAIILIDEPTSGLDSSMAHSLMKIMKAYTIRYNKTVITTIHQPSSQIFYSFDKILLLSDGKMAYYGTTENIVDHFSRIGLQCAPHFNPADFILEKVKSEETVKEMIISAGEKLSTSDFWLAEVEALAHGRERDSEGPGASQATCLASKENIVKANANGTFIDNGSMENETLHNRPDHSLSENAVTVQMDNAYELSDIDKYYDGNVRFQSSGWTQFRVLFLRDMKQALPRILSKLKVAQHIIVSIMVAAVWFQLERKEETLADTNGVLFVLGLYWILICLFDVLFVYPSERPFIMREREAGSYTLLPYFFSKWLSETTLHLIMPAVYITIVYWGVGLKDVTGFFASYGVVLLVVQASTAGGWMIATAHHDFPTIQTTGTLFVMGNILCGGFYTNKIPFWLDWIKYTSVTKYAFDSLLTIEFTDDDPITCTSQKTSIFKECLEPNVTSVASDVYLVKRNVLPLWTNILCLIGLIGIFRIVAYILLRIKGPKSHY